MTSSILTHRAPDFGALYHTLLDDILHSRVEEVNSRTGRTIRVHPQGPVSFSVDLSNGELPVTGSRRLYPGTAAAEVAWFLRGDQDVDFIRRYAPIWDKFVEDDGKTVKAAYGHRWRHHFGRDQLGLALEALSDNSTDRRVYVSAWDPSEDGLGAEGQRNVPCPVGFTLSVQDGRLCSAIMMRSSDVFVGLPYDVMGHALLMDAVSSSLGVDLGHMHFTLAHAHLYDVHFDMAQECLNGPRVRSELLLPDWTVEEITDDPHAYVEEAKGNARSVAWPTFAPRPEVVL